MRRKGKELRRKENEKKGCWCFLHKGKREENEEEDKGESISNI